MQDGSEKLVHIYMQGELVQSIFYIPNAYQFETDRLAFFFLRLTDHL